MSRNVAHLFFVRLQCVVAGELQRAVAQPREEGGRRAAEAESRRSHGGLRCRAVEDLSALVTPLAPGGRRWQVPGAASGAHRAADGGRRVCTVAWDGMSPFAIEDGS